MTAVWAGVADVHQADDLREQLSTLRALLALSMLMTEVSDEDAIFELVAEALPAMTPCRLEGISLGGGRWQWARGRQPEVAVQLRLEERLGRLGRMGGGLDLPGRRWAWAYPMRSIAGHAGFLVVSAPVEPEDHQQFHARVLAQQTALALSNAWWHERERATAQQLADANVRLEETVASLRQGMELHERLTEAAASGVGVEGIARAVHERTGLGVVVEDRRGRRQAAVGLETSARLPSGSRRDLLLKRALERTRPQRSGNCWIALARAGSEILGVLVLIDPDQTVGDLELMALEYGATVLAMVLAHVQSLAEVELRLRRASPTICSRAPTSAASFYGRRPSTTTSTGHTASWWWRPTTSTPRPCSRPCDERRTRRGRGRCSSHGPTAWCCWHTRTVPGRRCTGSSHRT